jgi:hypothetical protein
VRLQRVGEVSGTDKAHPHTYLPHYEDEISRLDRPGGGVLLELGVLDGASTAMWRRWLPPSWVVIGLDIEHKEPVAGTLFVHGPQDDPAAVQAAADLAPGGLTVVVDDASHESEKTIRSFELLWPHLQPGGLYFVEDLRTSYHLLWNDYPGPTIMEHLKGLADRVHDEGSEYACVKIWPGLGLVQKATPTTGG